MDISKRAEARTSRVTEMEGMEGITEVSPGAGPMRSHSTGLAEEQKEYKRETGGG